MDKIGSYEIIKEVGEGALAIVYQAKDPKLNRHVALKVLHPIFSKNKKNLDRLRQEAQTLAQLDHPNIIRIYDFLDTPDSKGIITEFVEGFTLAQFLKENETILPEMACKIVCELLSALEHAHSRKIIHRDIKPENIIIHLNGSIKLADFSIAKILDQQSLTLTGQLIGSPFYISPEQASGQSADERSDLFSLGILFYRMVVGELPFYDEDSASLLKKILNKNPASMPSSINPKIPPTLDKIITQALAKNKEDRYQKAWEMRYDILKYLKKSRLTLEELQLKEFFQDPKAYSKTLRKNLSQHYCTLGQEAFQSKKFIHASQLWNKALEYDPQNTSVLAHLQTNQSRKTKSTWQKTISIFVVATAILYLYLKPKPLEQLPLKALPEQTVQKPEKQNIIPPPVPTIVWSYLKINKEPSTKFLLDNKEIILDPSGIVKLEPGSYRITFRKPGFKDINATVKLKAGETSTINIGEGS